MSIEENAQTVARKRSSPGPATVGAAAELPAEGARHTGSRRRRWVLRLSLLLLSTVLALFIGEMYVRAFMPQVLFPRYVTDSAFGIRVNVPNARYWHTSPEMKVQFRINSMGLRSDREYTFEKPSGVIRVVGLGDSFTQGYEVDVGETYLYLLEDLLSAGGRPVEVINLGVSGFGTAEQLIFLKEFGFRFDPDFVIVGYFQNDVGDNIRSKLYRLDENGRLGRDAAAYLPAVGIRNKLYSFWAYRRLAENSQMFALARERLASRVQRRIFEANVQASPAREDDQYPPRLTARLLDEIKRECDERQVGFVVLDIPKFNLGESNLPVPYLERAGEDDLIRTLPSLRAEPTDAYVYRNRGHRHWAPRGHQIAAQLLADRLSKVLNEMSTKSDDANSEG